ncbi:MAG: hypothetical protein AAFX06_00150 [Planctomycetota bacterium]
MRPLAFALLLAALPLPSSFAQEPKPGIPTAPYRDVTIEDWPVRVSERLLADSPKATQKALDLLAAQIVRLREALPATAFEKVRRVRIWFSPPYPGFGPSGEYHPSAGWLRRNGRPEGLHRCIEFTNVKRFEAEIERMPVLLLHEVAHAYHDQQLGFDHPEIVEAYERAKAGAKYERVERHDGAVVKHYALTNPMEYFAELSEAYFGVNDFFPFNREQLEAYDPKMFALLKRVWNTP